MAEARPCPSRRSWSDLPPELDEEVFGRLPTLADCVRFAAVCPRWRAAARKLPLPRPPLPLLALEDGTFYSLPGKERLRLPGFDGSDHHGTCGKWLVFWHKDGFDLVDPFSKATMSLPQLPGYEDDDGSISKKAKLILCSPCLIAALVTTTLLSSYRILSTRIAVCHPLGSSWSVYLDDEHDRAFKTLTFHQGKLYALDFFGNLLAIEISEHDGADHPQVSRLCQAINPGPMSPYLNLVESHGELLMVRRVLYFQSNWPRKEQEKLKTVREFGVFKADFKRSEWVDFKVTKLGVGEALFLGQRCSRAVDVSQYGMPGDHIFFLDDDFGFEHAAFCWKNGDALVPFGAYDMKDGELSNQTVSCKNDMLAGAWLFPRD